MSVTEPAPPPGVTSPGISKKMLVCVWTVLILALFGLGFLLYRAYPAHHTAKKSPSFIDSIFANNIVLFGARLVLFSAALVLTFVASYVIYSIVKGMNDGKTLTKFGPFQIQEAEDLSGDVEMYQSLWAQATDENAELRERLEATDALLKETAGAVVEKEETNP